MSDITITNIVLVFLATGITITLVVWLLVKTKIGRDHANSMQRGDESNCLNERDSMQVSDWINAAVNVVLGLLFGIVIVSLGRLITTVFWPVAIFILILFAGFLLFDKLIDVVFEKIFPSGIRPARKSAVRNRAPLPRLLSMPVGILLGVALGLLDMGGKFLGMI